MVTDLEEIKIDYFTLKLSLNIKIIMLSLESDYLDNNLGSQSQAVIRLQSLELRSHWSPGYRTVNIDSPPVRSSLHFPPLSRLRKKKESPPAPYIMQTTELKHSKQAKI